MEETSKEGNYEGFREKLVSAKAKGKDGKEGPGPRYAVYDVEYDAPGGEGKRYVLILVLLMTARTLECLYTSVY